MTHTFIRSARSPTVVSIIAGAQGAARAVILVTASLASKSLPPCVPVVSRFTSSRQRTADGAHSGPADGAVRTKPSRGTRSRISPTTTAVSITQDQVKLKSDRKLAADFVVAGIGVRPRIDLARKAGLLVERGVVVESPSSKRRAPGVHAAGDIARWPDKYSGANIRVEHWVVAERQGQTAALNMMGHREPFAAVPYFSSQHYDVPINYVGHAERWDEIVIDGDIPAKDCVVRFKQEGRTRAIASIYRDRESLQAEISMERQTDF